MFKFKEFSKRTDAYNVLSVLQPQSLTGTISWDCFDHHGLLSHYGIFNYYKDISKNFINNYHYLPVHSK